MCCEKTKKGVGFMAIHVSPGVYSKIIDLSEYVQMVPGTIGFVVIVSEQGPDNELVFTNSRDFYLDFGEPNIKYLKQFGKAFGQGPYVADSFLKQSSALYVIRALPDSATFANIFAFAERYRIGDNDATHTYKLFDTSGLKFTETETSVSITDETIPVTTDSIPNYIYKVRYCKVFGLNTEKEISTWVNVNNPIAFNPDSTVSPNLGQQTFHFNFGKYSADSNFNITLLDGTDQKVFSPFKFNDTTTGLLYEYEIIPLFFITGRGRGGYYNNFKIDISQHSVESKRKDRIFILDIYKRNKKLEFNEYTQQWEETFYIDKSFEISFNPNKVDDSGESMFISDVINKYYRELICYSHPTNCKEVDSFFSSLQPADNLLSKRENFIRYSAKTTSLTVTYEGTAYDPSMDSVLVEKLNNMRYFYNSSYFIPYIFNGIYDLGTSTKTERILKWLVCSFDFDYELTITDVVRLDKGGDGWDVRDGTISEDNIYANLKDYVTRAYQGKLPRSKSLSEDNVTSSALYVDEVLDTEDYYFSLVFDAGYPDDVKRNIVELCKMRGDCVCILDNGDNMSAEQAISHRQSLSGLLNINTYHAAIYEGYTKIYDMYTGADIWVSPVYHMANIIPYTDNVAEMWYAPAGFNRGTLTTVKGMRYSPKLEQRDQMYLVQLNPIVKFNVGTVIWGQLTSQRRPSAMQDLNIVRLVLYIKRALERFCRFYVFEQNLPETWEAIKKNIEMFLEVIKARKGLYSYSVEVGATEYEIKAKQIHANIILNPVRVVEQIHLNFFIV